MARGNYRRPYVKPFDPSITQKVKNALYDAGREDLVDALMESGLKEMEEGHEKLKKRIIALELERVNWVTESGMFRALDARAGKIVVGWGKRALQWAAGAAGLGVISLIGWAVKIVWKAAHP